MSDNGISYLTKDSNLSKTIGLLRFPMAVLIVLKHSSFEYEMVNGISIFEHLDAKVYHHLDYLFARNICDIAVPLFFVISGYLFFINFNVLSFDRYISKLKTRCKTILIPYVIWNFLILLLYILVQNIAPAMNSGRNKLVEDYTISDYLMSFWSMRYINVGGMSGPINTPLWFIRDLMVMFVLSPIFFLIIKYTKYFVVIMILCLYVSGIWVGIPGFETVSIAFFMLGAYLGMNKIDFSFYTRKVLWQMAVIYFSIIGFLVFQMDESILFKLQMEKVTVIIGIILSSGVASFMIQRGKNPSIFLTSSVFFLFASHCEILKIFVRLLSRLQIQSDVFYCLCFFLCPAVTIILLLAVYRLISRYMPKISNVLSGSRG